MKGEWRMKRLFCALFAMMILLAATASAQEYVSVSELYEQAQAMGGVWQETFSTPSGEMAVDVMIEVPNIEKLPVITVDKAKISEELFNQIAQGKCADVKEGEHQYEIELDGRLMEFFLGRDNDYIYGEQTDNTGYDAVSTLWIQHGSYRISQGTAIPAKARPRTWHEADEIDLDRAYARGREITVGECMRLWQQDIESTLGDGYVIKPVHMYVNGSNLIKNTGKDKVHKRDGNMYITAEQYLEGLPVFGALAGYESFGIGYVSTQQTNRIADKLNPYRIGVDYCETRLAAYFSTEEDYRTMSDLVKVRTVEHEDIPVASLESVLGTIEKEIKEGRIHNILSIRLGYILYSNPEMTDYAWAVPRWVVDCEYVSNDRKRDYERYKKKTDSYIAKLVPTLEDENVYVYAGEDDPWMNHYTVDLPMDAQSGELIIFTTGDKETFSVPKIITWDDVK